MLGGSVAGGRIHKRSDIRAAREFQGHLQHGFRVGDGFYALGNVVTFAVKFFAELRNQGRGALLINLAK